MAKIRLLYFRMLKFLVIITLCHEILACENTINEFLPFSTFNKCHRYTSVKTTVFLH